jgi:hypothetical protein
MTFSRREKMGMVLFVLVVLILAAIFPLKKLLVGSTLTWLECSIPAMMAALSSGLTYVTNNL